MPPPPSPNSSFLLASLARARPRYEVCGATVTSKGRVSSMVSEFAGTHTPQTMAKPEMDQNIWAFCLGESPETAEDSRNLPPMVSPAMLLKRVLAALPAGSAVRSLKKGFAAMDAQGDGKLDREDLKWGLRDLGVVLEDDQFNILFDDFDASGDGIISMGEFVEAVRGDMSDARKDAVLNAYEALDPEGSGMVTVDDTIGMDSSDGLVTRREFVDFYKDLSAEIDSDDEFVQVVAAQWNL